MQSAVYSLKIKKKLKIKIASVTTIIMSKKTSRI